MTNSIRNRLFFAFCLCLSLLICSCNSELTKSRATDIIKETYDFPLHRTELFQHGEILYSRHYGGTNMSEMKHLTEQGMITFENKGTKKDDFFMYDKYHLEFTADGLDYKEDEKSTPDGRRFHILKSADVRFNEVTELLTTTEDSAKVDFTWSYTNITPFGIAANLRMRDYSDMCGITYAGDEYEEERTFHESVVFVKGEKGWKIMPPLALRGGLIQIPTK